MGGLEFLQENQSAIVVEIVDVAIGRSDQRVVVERVRVDGICGDGKTTWQEQNAGQDVPGQLVRERRKARVFPTQHAPASVDVLKGKSCDAWSTSAHRSYLVAPVLGLALSSIVVSKCSNFLRGVGRILSARGSKRSSCWVPHFLNRSVDSLANHPAFERLQCDPALQPVAFALVADLLPRLLIEWR